MTQIDTNQKTQAQLYHECRDVIGVGRTFLVVSLIFLIFGIGCTLAQYYGSALTNPLFLLPGFGVSVLFISPLTISGLIFVIKGHRGIHRIGNEPAKNFDPQKIEEQHFPI